jgi:lipopolysaccharide biosynthesis regulator YciM
MEFEYWWLLAFPLFFGLGWLAARIDIKHLISESRSLPESYFKGLNFLLNEQPDQAIEAFIQVVKDNNPETVELHFALGSLFRRRGEMERAIRMHQGLVERADLGQDRRLAATFELGQDYQKAGLLDRAEQIFSGMLETPYSETALKFLLEIYVHEKEWLKAIDTAKRLGAISSRSHQKEIAQYYCELAASEIAHSRQNEAKQHLEEALRINRRCVRANVMLGELAMAARDHGGAIRLWKQIETQDPAYLHLVAEKMLESYRALGRLDEGLELLQDYLVKYSSLDMLNIVFQSILEARGPAAAHRVVRDELRRNPTLQGLDRLLEVQLIDAPPERHHDLQLIKNLLHQHTRRLALYRCEGCGFNARRFYWQCPACGGWETYSPKRNEEALMEQ